MLRLTFTPFFNGPRYGVLGVRLSLLALEGLSVLLAGLILPVALPLPSMGLVVALHGALIVFAALQRDAAEGSDRSSSLFFPLAADAAVLAALLYFSGGYANPFVSLLLVPLILAAVMLPARAVWAMTAWVALLYTMLARFYLPLRLELDTQAAIDLHLGGMWLNFLITAGLVAGFVARLAAALRARERQLAELRETALRDEQLFALGMQAAAAAHDLSTPLNTLVVSLGELQRDFAGDDELGPELGLMREQAERMKFVLDRLAMAAGAGRARAGESVSLAEWLRGTFEHWQLMRPQAPATLTLTGLAKAPAQRAVRDEPLLVSVIATLLNNAADASPETIEMQASCSADELLIEVLDRGPGLGSEVQAGSKPGGWGVGLTLAQATLARFEGGLVMHPRPGGGLVVSVRIPLARLELASEQASDQASELA